MGTPQEVTERIVGLAEHGDANTVQIGFNRGAMRQEMFFGTDPPLHPRRAADRAGTPGEPRTGSRGDQGALTGSRKDNNNGEAFSGSYAATGADPDAMATQHLDVAHGNPVVALFSDGYALRTIMLWIMFLASMLSLYLIGVWLPTVLHLEGCHPLTQCSRPALRCRMRPERISTRPAGHRLWPRTRVHHLLGMRHRPQRRRKAIPSCGGRDSSSPEETRGQMLTAQPTPWRSSADLLATHRLLDEPYDDHQDASADTARSNLAYD